MSATLHPRAARSASGRSIFWAALVVVALTVLAGGITGTALAAAIPPSLTSPGNQTGSVGTAVSLSVARTGGTSPFTWTATGLPAGLAINASSGVVSGTPSTAGTSTTKITIADAAKATTNVSFTWTVAIRVVNPGPQTATVGVAVNLVMARNGGTSPFTWSATGLPLGLSIAAGTGVITGKPTAAGTASSSVKVTDSAGRTGSTTVTWTMTTPPAVTNPGNRTITVGLATSLAVAATGGTTPYAWAATGLPAGLTINATTGVVSGAYSCEGVLDYKAKGTHTFIARIARADGSSVRVVSLPEDGTFAAYDPTMSLAVKHEVYYPSTGAVPSVMIIAMAKGDLTSSPYYLEIEDRTTRTVFASCATSWMCMQAGICTYAWDAKG